MNSAVEVAKAALCEAGYPEIAETVYANKDGNPASPWKDLKEIPWDHPEVKAITRAFCLAHIYMDHYAHINHPPEWGLCCHECWDYMCKEYYPFDVGNYPCREYT